MFPTSVKDGSSRTRENIENITFFLSLFFFCCNCCPNFWNAASFCIWILAYENGTVFCRSFPVHCLHASLCWLIHFEMEIWNSITWIIRWHYLARSWECLLHHTWLHIQRLNVFVAGILKKEAPSVLWEWFSAMIIFLWSCLRLNPSPQDASGLSVFYLQLLKELFWDVKTARKQMSFQSRSLGLSTV